MTIEGPKPINTLSVVGNLDMGAPETELRFADGRTVRVPTALFQQKQAFGSVQQASFSGDETILIPLVEESFEVGKRTVETGKVHLRKSSEAHEVTTNEPLAVNSWKVERVPKNEVVAEPPAFRQDGNTTIYPLLEERLILTKQLVLVEEVHVTQEISERRDAQTITLLRETLSVEREPVQPA